MSTTRRPVALGRLVLVALAAALLAAGPPPAVGVAAKAGALDPSFSPSAPAGVSDLVADRQLVDVAQQQDGKIVAISDRSDDFYVVRFNPDGSLDTSFGDSGTGVVTVDVSGGGATDYALAVTVDPQNRIVVAGGGAAQAQDFALVRLSADGKAVQISSHVHIGNAADHALAFDVAIQSDGTIVLAGIAKVGSDTDFALARFNGTTGAVLGGSPVTQTLGTGNEEATGVTVYPTGPNKDKIVVSGTTGGADSGIGLIQRNADGTLDPSFGGGSGQVIIQPTATADVGRGVAVTSSGSVLVSGVTGAADRDAVLAQLLPSGMPDPAFNGGALRTLSTSGDEFSRNHPLALQPDGKVLLGVDTADGTDAGVFRLNADGSADSGFGTEGLARFDVGGNDDVNAVAVDTAGRILVAGDSGLRGFMARLFGISSDEDGDGVPDYADACPSVAGATPSGCPVVGRPAAVLKGKKVLINTVLAKTKASAKCPAKAKVVVKTKTKKGKLTVTKMLKTRSVATGCAVKGKVTLSAKPKKTAKTKVTISGKQLKTKRLVAVRQ